MGKKVLIVDDTKNIRLMLTKCLELEGYCVECASDGKQGLEAALSGRYDLIFLDIKLPEISGTEVLRRLRAAGVTSKVIVITAYPTIKNAVECTRLGVITYLQKPFTAERLRGVLKEMDLRDGAETQRQLELAEKALEEKDAVRALPLLQAALGEDPRNGRVYMLIGLTYELMGDEENAQRFRQAAQLFSQ